MDRITMKDIPKEDRPYERCMKTGPGVLSDAELLAVIIRTGSKEASSLELAQKILALNYPREGILGLLHLSLPELMQLKGIGEVKGIQLLCIGELSKRIWKKAAMEETSAFTTPRDIVNFYVEDMRHMEQEELRVMLLNNRGILIRDIWISKGTVNSSLVSPRELFIEALRYHAVHIAMAHNHPSGDPSPSKADLELTQRIQSAGKLLDIGLIDHVIIGDNSYFSFKERGLL